jgi:DNA-binding HxlR family transcriptional regulator
LTERTIARVSSFIELDCYAEAMLPSTYNDQNCSIAASLEVVGERWTILVVRDALLGIRRFEDFQARLGVSRAVLSDRLSRLVEHGVLERVRYQERPERYEYTLTERGLALWPVVAALAEWGRDLFPEGAPRRFRHRTCTSAVHTEVHCPDCGQDLSPLDVLTSPAPGATVSRGEHMAQPVRDALSRERPLLEPVRA